jgi:hypothetical protein
MFLAGDIHVAAFHLDRIAPFRRLRHDCKQPPGNSRIAVNLEVCAGKTGVDDLVGSEKTAPGAFADSGPMPTSVSTGKLTASLE